MKGLLRHLARPTGPSLPRTTLEEFLALLRPFSVDSLVAGLCRFSWDAWRNKLPTRDANILSSALAPALAAYALAEGSKDPNARTASFKDIADLQFRFLAVNNVPGALLDEHERE